MHLVAHAPSMKVSISSSAERVEMTKVLNIAGSILASFGFVLYSFGVGTIAFTVCSGTAAMAYAETVGIVTASLAALQKVYSYYQISKSVQEADRLINMF